MLTKEHIKARVRGKKVVPDFIESKDVAAKKLAASIVGIFLDAEGDRLGSVRERLSEVSGDAFLTGAFFKLVTDRCEFDDFDETIEQQRWRLFAASKKVRDGNRSLTLEGFRAAVSAELVEDFAGQKERIYGDLPELKTIRSIDHVDPEELVNRYNIAQIQGLLLRSHSLTITLDGESSADLRHLFHQIKFHRLLADLVVDKKKKKTVVTLSGPLAQFEQASSYGMQLAVFFPHLLSLSHWSAVAEVEHKRGRVHQLAIGTDSGIRPIYKAKNSFVPEELTLFVETFNNESSRFKAERGGSVVNLGQEQYLVPDITITSQTDGRLFSVELFHKWHASQMMKRLEILELTKKQGVLLGIARSVAKKPEIAKRLKDSCWFDKNGFLFSEFPTAKKVFSLMSEVCRDD